MFWDFDGRNVAMILWREACLTTEKIPFSVVFVFQAMLTYHNSDVRKNKLNNKKRSFSSEKLPSDFLAGKKSKDDAGEKVCPSVETRKRCFLKLSKSCYLAFGPKNMTNVLITPYLLSNSTYTSSIGSTGEK